MRKGKRSKYIISSKVKTFVLDLNDECRQGKRSVDLALWGRAYGDMAIDINTSTNLIKQSVTSEIKNKYYNE